MLLLPGKNWCGKKSMRGFLKDKNYLSGFLRKYFINVFTMGNN